jgi:hypothetical protein
MSASTEVRVPFVDPEVFRAAFSFRGSQKIKGRTQKIPLRAIAEAWLPAEVVDRPKAAFGAPLRAWVTNDLGPLIDDVLLDGQLVGSGFLRRSSVQQMVTEQRTGRTDQSKQLWQLLSMELRYRGARSAGDVGSVSTDRRVARDRIPSGRPSEATLSVVTGLISGCRARDRGVRGAWLPEGRGRRKIPSGREVQDRWDGNP